MENRLYVRYYNRPNINASTLIQDHNLYYLELITLKNTFRNITRVRGNNVLFYDPGQASITLEDGCYTFDTINNQILKPLLYKILLNVAGTHYEIVKYATIALWFDGLISTGVVQDVSALSRLNTEIYTNKLEIDRIKIKCNLFNEYHTTLYLGVVSDDELVHAISADIGLSLTTYFTPPLMYDTSTVSTMKINLFDEFDNEIQMDPEHPMLLVFRYE